MDEREQLSTPEDVEREIRKLYRDADALTVPLSAAEEKRIRLKADLLKVAMANIELRRRLAPVPAAPGAPTRLTRREEDAAGNPQSTEKPSAGGPFDVVPPVRARTLG